MIKPKRNAYLYFYDINTKPIDAFTITDKDIVFVNAVSAAFTGNGWTLVDKVQFDSRTRVFKQRVKRIV